MNQQDINIWELKLSIKYWLWDRLPDILKISYETFEVAIVYFYSRCYHCDHLHAQISTNCEPQYSMFPQNIHKEIREYALTKHSW